VISDVGPDYERALILAVFRSAAADVTARYMAKDMHSGSRGAIEAEIRDLMAKNLNDRGFDVEAVLLKSITLPPGLYQAVEAKLAAEQEAQRMQFVLQREELEAQRKRIEAEGVAAAQGALAGAISPAVIEWARIEAFRALATSPNAKVIVAPAEANLMMPIDGHVPAR
jgi:regulator of protease activity HflC (stomatin/prohibitin superfamily)